MSTVKFAISSEAPSLRYELPTTHDTGHVVQFYRQDSSLLDSLSHSIGPSLEAGDAIVVIATKGHRLGLAERLVAMGLELETIRRSGRYLSLDANETLSKFMVEEMPDAGRFAELAGTIIQRATLAARPIGGRKHRVFAFGEMVALLWGAGKSAAAIRLEQLWNDLATTHSFSLHCAYPLKSFDRVEHGEPFLQICGEHSVVIPDESYEALETEQERRRTVTYLQQKAQALETEKVQRMSAECSLRRIEDQLAELERQNLEMLERTERLEMANRDLRELSIGLLRVHDSECRHVAHDLNENTGQILALLSIKLSGLEAEARKLSPILASGLAENIGAVKQASTELRALSYLLHPPLLDELGLASALRWLVDGFETRTGVRVTLELPDNLARLSTDMEVAIYRAVQECLANVHRHSGSPVATVRLSQSLDELALQIEDRGRGIASESFSGIASKEASGLGLRVMRERIGDFRGNMQVSCRPDGTRISITLPLPEYARESRIAGDTGL